MRLHRLAITAFGPFAGSEEVDLDVLSSCGLFLIHGPTGAGKTSILDAICFALYGCVPGARTGARASLRSDHAPQGAVPEVTLEFTAAGRRFRVCRSPEFSRPKKRGTGQTTVPSRVLLDELAGAEWTNVATRNDEVALVLKDILGMGLEQFIKVVLLPQGDFAAFLRASPEERRSVLEKLFDTQRFADIEKWLAERRRLSASAVGAARDLLSTGLLRVNDVIARLSAGEDIVELPSDIETPEIAQVLGALTEAVDVRASVALSGFDLARSGLAHTELALHQGVAVARHQETAAQARACLDGLDEQQSVYQDAARCVQRSERAGAVAGFVAAALDAAHALEASMVEVSKLREPLARMRSLGRHVVEHGATERGATDCGSTDSGSTDSGSTDGDATERDGDMWLRGSLIEQVEAHSDALQRALLQDGEAEKLAEESVRHSQAALTAEAESAALALLRNQVATGQVSAESSRDASRSALAEIPALEARQASLSRIQQLIDDQERSARQCEALQGQAASAHTLSLDMREVLLDLRERRLAGMAAEVAAELGADDPCPVCGSCVHPSLAMTTDAVSPADIELAEANQTRASEILSGLRSSIAAEQASQEARAAELGTYSSGMHSELFRQGPLSAPAVLEAVSVLDDVLAEVRSAASGLPLAQAELLALTVEAERLRVLDEQSAATRASSLALEVTSRVQSQKARAEVTKLISDHSIACPCEPEHPGDPASVLENSAMPMQAVVPGNAVVPGHANVPGKAEVAEVWARHRQVLHQLRALACGFRELDAHRTNANDCVLRLTTALQANGFDSAEQVQAATLPQARVVELTALMRTAEQQRAQATALLAQTDVVRAMTRPTPDMEALAAAHKQASVTLDETGRLHTLSEQAARELRTLSVTVHRALADLGPAQQEAELVQKLADCFAGNSPDNALRMRLSSYVLASRLAEIADLANERLTTMSDGRYTLEYTDARAAKGARSGLGLLVRDAWTGQTRETSSLSGGEAFMASLALALGMGDAVRAEAGGFDLQTLFVDEGFGSLDEESLEQVMAVLDTLREGGRAVGIVSHVAELRTRIPSQLLVLKQQAGSRIRMQSLDRPAA
jgi:exonuclease SbcC